MKTSESSMADGSFGRATRRHMFENRSMIVNMMVLPEKRGRSVMKSMMIRGSLTRGKTKTSTVSTCKAPTWSMKGWVQWRMVPSVLLSSILPSFLALWWNKAISGEGCSAVVLPLYQWSYQLPRYRSVLSPYVLFHSKDMPLGESTYFIKNSEFSITISDLYLLSPSPPPNHSLCDIKNN